MHAVHHAFAHETELELRPDDIQLAIVQTVAAVVGKSAEKLRGKLGVDFDGKQEIIVEHNGLLRGEAVAAATPKWATVFPVFESEINKRLRSTPTLNAVQLQFTTTTAEDRLVRQVALMDVVKSFFEYTVMTKCGITKVHLLGTAQDWKSIHDTMDIYEKELEMGWYTKPVRQILHHFVRATAGEEVDVEFWDSMYKYQSMSGGGYANGWILALFASDAEKFLEKCSWGQTNWNKHMYTKVVSDVSEYGSGLCQVPFVWDYLGTKIPMKFCAGYAHPDLTKQTVTRPQTGWSVMYTKSQT